MIIYGIDGVSAWNFVVGVPAGAPKRTPLVPDPGVSRLTPHTLTIVISAVELKMSFEYSKIWAPSALCPEADGHTETKDLALYDHQEQKPPWLPKFENGSKNTAEPSAIHSVS